MNMNEKIIKYLDGDITPEEKLDFEKEKSLSVELQQQFLMIESALKKSAVIKDSVIGDGYFINMIPLFRSKQHKSQNRIMNPSYAGSIILIFTFVITLLIQNNLSTNIPINENIVYDKFDQEEISLILNNINYQDSGLDLTVSEEINMDSLINSYISDDVLSETGNESIVVFEYEFNPDDVQLSESDADNLYAAILNKKFF